MKTIKITYSNGETTITNINGTEEEIRRYYIGQEFELDETKPTVKAVAVEFI